MIKNINKKKIKKNVQFIFTILFFSFLSINYFVTYYKSKENLNSIKPFSGKVKKYTVKTEKLLRRRNGIGNLLDLFLGRDTIVKKHIELEINDNKRLYFSSPRILLQINDEIEGTFIPSKKNKDLGLVLDLKLPSKNLSERFYPGSDYETSGIELIQGVLFFLILVAVIIFRKRFFIEEPVENS